MGFFKDFKNDMKQAVNELIPGNEEMVSEYDDEDMVNTLEEPEDTEYINTIDAPEEGEAPLSGANDVTVGTSEDDFADIAFEDLDDLDIDAEEFDEEVASYESDMDSLADLLSGNLTVEDVERQELPHTRNQEPEVSYEPVEKPESSETVDAGTDIAEDVSAENVVAELVADINITSEQEEIEAEAGEQEKAREQEEAREEKPEELLKEEALVSEDKIIDITSIKETEIVTEPVPSSGAESSNDELENAVSDSTTYITKGTRIEGNVFTDGSIDIIGTVEGDVNCYGKLIISGSIHGKVNAGEIYANAAKVEGEIVSAGSVKIGVGSVIVGNIEAQSAVIAGAVHGDLDVKGPVIVDSTAVIMGNIKSRSVQINNGAVIEGFCSQCYSDIDVKSFFA